MNIALVHDSLTQQGGAERVLEAFHEMFPKAPVFVLVKNRQFKEKYRQWDIRTSWLQVVYDFFPKFQWLFPLIPLALRSFKFNGFDLVLSSSSSFAKNIRLPEGVIHINYCHTPTRFLWIDEDYIAQEVPGFLMPLVKLLIKWMKKWDYSGARRVTYFIANSRQVQERIKNIYGRSSTVIEPFVNTSFWKPTKEKGNYFLLAGRLQAHKNNELVIRIFNKLGLPLRVAGTGRQEKYLKSISRANITFLGRLTDEQLRDEYSGARAYIFPQLEDFGLMPLEAAACGTATIAYGKGGSLETVVQSVTGELFLLPEELIGIINSWDENKYSAEILATHAEKFNRGRFENKIADFIASSKDLPKFEIG